MVKEVFGYLHSHWDREWYKTFEEYRLRLIDVLDDIFAKIENNEIPSFYLDGQTIALSDYLEIFPQKTSYVNELIKKNKLFIGPFYDLADEFLVNGESLCRNLQIGIKEAQKHNATNENFIGYLPDAFGHCRWMPMIFKLASIDKAIIWRGVGNAHQEFYWQSPDGSKIKTVFLKNGYYQDFFTQKSYKKSINKLLKNLETICPENTPILLPIGADHLACEDKIKSKIKNFNRNNNEFKIKLSSLNEYFSKTSSNNNLCTIKEEFRNNLNNYILPSVASSRIYLKQANILLEWKLGKIAEPLWAILSQQYPKFSKPEIFEYAWKLLIQNHAHDSICGCSLDEVHRENQIRYEKIEQLSQSLIDNAVYILGKEISKKEIGIFNFSNYDFDGVISFYSDKKLPLISTGKKKAFPIEISQDIHNIPVQENYHYYHEYLTCAKINGLSFKTIKPYSAKCTELLGTNNLLENEYIKAELSSNGTLTLTNKTTSQVFYDILKITDEADVGDSYNFSCIPNDKKLTAKFKNSKLTENNELRKVLKLTYTLNIPSHAKNDATRSRKKLKHEFSIELSLTAKSKRLEAKVEYENFSKDHILKISFNLPQSIDTIKCEDTFGIIERKYQPGYDYKKLLPAKPYTEVDLNTGVMQRFVMAQGLCVLTKGLQEYEVEKNNLNITLLRCFGIIAKRRLITRAAAAGPPLPTPEAQCIGKQQAEFSILLTNDEQEAIQEADFYFNPFVIIDGKSTTTNFKSQSFLNLPDDFYLYSLKIADDKEGIIAKIFNLSNKSRTLTISKEKTIYETNLLEENLNNKNLANEDILFNPQELKIFRIKT